MTSLSKRRRSRSLQISKKIGSRSLRGSPCVGDTRAAPAKPPTANLPTYALSMGAIKATPHGTIKISPLIRLDSQGPGRQAWASHPPSLAAHHRNPTRRHRPLHRMRGLATPTRCPAITNHFRHLAISLQTQPSSRGPATPSRFFLDVFAGVNAPLSQAADKAGLDRYEPLDIVSNAEHDILLDSTFESLLRLCWIEATGLIVCAPPCKDAKSIAASRCGGPGTTSSLAGDSQLRTLSRVSRPPRLGGRLSPWQGLGQKLVLRQQQRQNRPPCRPVQPQYCTPVHRRCEKRLMGVPLHNYGGISSLSSKEIFDSVSFRVAKNTLSPLPLPFGRSSTPSLPAGPRLKMCDGAGN